MQRHVFIATRLGWDENKDVVWFDADKYTREEAESHFVPVACMTEKKVGYVPYTAYDYDGVRYHDFHYVGLRDEENMP